MSSGLNEIQEKKKDKRVNGKTSTPMQDEASNTPQDASPLPAKSFCTTGLPLQRLPEEFVEGIRELESALKMPVWMLIRGSGELEDLIWKLFYRDRSLLEKHDSIALVIHSPGGQAKTAFQIGSLLQQQCKNGFVAVVPEYAKSAATLLSLGATEILMNNFAELGPLDAQLFDREREGVNSALDEVQALERLHADALAAIDQTMYFLLPRTGKKVETLLPHILTYAAKMMKPLLENIDTVHYTQMSRVLKVAEEYATRLLKPKYKKEKAQEIARSLVEKYPEHGFVIDHREAKDIGLSVRTPNTKEQAAFAKIEKYLSQLTVIGTLIEMKENIQ